MVNSTKIKQVAVVILNFNGEKSTVKCVESLLKSVINGLKLTIIVVDNGSKKESADFIRQKTKNINFGDVNFVFLETHANLGFSGGMNFGIKYAMSKNADYIVILNNDTIADKNMIVELVGFAQTDEKIGIVSPKIYFAKGFEFHKDRYREEEKGKVFWYAGGIIDWANVIGKHRGVDEVDIGQYEKASDTQFASGCCFLAKKEVWEKVGLFDEKYFLYYEDIDLGTRIKKTGFKIVYAPQAVLWHENAGSAGGSGSVLQDYYITRNRLFFGIRYAPIRTKLALFRESIRTLISGRKWQKRGILDFYLGKMGKGSFKI